MLGIVLGSCHDFLNEYPKDQVYATTTDDLSELLIGDGYIPSSSLDIGIWFNLMDDDVLFFRTSTTRASGCDFHWWEPNPKTQSTWNALYKRIGVVNAVLEEVEEFKEELGIGYRRVKGEAHFLRGAYYYFLVNLYGQPYRAETAATEPGVPLKLYSKVEDKRYDRQTVKACYDQILSDLETAVTCLEGITPTTTFRAGEAAARILLSRVYLYLGEWEKCVSQCDATLKNSSQRLRDFNTLSDTVAVNVNSPNSPETIFTSGGNNYSALAFNPLFSPRFMGSEEMINLYTPDDLRGRYFFQGTAGNSPKKQVNTNDGICSDFFLLRLAEAYLNRAEALTMLSRDAEAIEDVKRLREKRLETGSVDVLSYSGEALVNFIRDERRREFTFEGQRWFDLRRYAVSPKWPFQKEIQHPYYEDNTTEINGNMVLLKYDEDREYYVLPIPENEVMLNGGTLIQNSERVWKEPR